MAALPVAIQNIWVGVDLIEAKVAPDPIRISKSAHQGVEWHCVRPEHSVLVCFEEEVTDAQGTVQKRSPFQETEFRVPMGGSVYSGAVLANAEEGEKRSYKYTVYNIDPNGRKISDKPLVDPRIIINP